jgi:hypothetical protein
VSAAGAPPGDPLGLLVEALPYLKAYRALLLESRGGAASDKEQHALRLTKAIERIEAFVADSPR